MKLSTLRVDAGAIEAGAWVENIPELEGVRLLVRGLQNSAHRRLQSKLIEAVPRSRKQSGRVDPEEMDRVISTCLLDTVLLDWDGLEDDDGAPLPYSKEQAREFLTDPNYRRFREGVIWAAAGVGDVAA